MIGIKDLYTHYIRKPLPEDCRIVCEPIDPAMAKLNRLLDDSISYFSYTLVTKGTAEVDFNGSRITLNPRDLMITTPGAKVYTLEVSDDFAALCLMADETTTYGSANARYAVLTAYAPSMILSQNKLSLSDAHYEALLKWMTEMVRYGSADTPLVNEFLISLHSLFVCQLMDVECLTDSEEYQYTHPSEIFLNFLRLLPANYARHHDIRFYADRLAVTTIYLSRIVRRHSGQTVKDHIDRLLLSDALTLLKRTDKPVAAIAEILNFANPQSFCKFFVRNKGISPREYRSAQQNTSTFKQ